MINIKSSFFKILTISIVMILILGFGFGNKKTEDNKLIVKNVFFDLNARKGDSVYKFLNGELIDVQTKLLEKWTLFVFEPNPKFSDDLNLMEKEIKTKHEIFLYTQTAAWLHDGLNKYNPNEDLIIKKEDHDSSDNIMIRCLDIVEFIKEFNLNDYVVVKIDIKNAEFNLLRHLINNNLLQKIDHLIIEYQDQISRINLPNDLYNAIYQSDNLRLKEINININKDLNKESYIQFLKSSLQSIGKFLEKITFS